MSANTSCSERALAALDAARRAERLPDDQVRALGEECPAEFFRIVVESLSDSFDPADAAAYQRLMRTWIPDAPQTRPVIPDRVDAVYVLSRVTLGSDIKITSVMLDAMKHRFPDARIVLVGGRKTAELFAMDKRVEHLEAEYPRSGPVSLRIAFAGDLRERLNLRELLKGQHRIVVDTDSRMTQLGLIPVCEPEHFFHFPSRTAGGESAGNLSLLTSHWLENAFGYGGSSYMAPAEVEIDQGKPFAAVSLGVGGNEEKRVHGNFETQVISALAQRYQTVWVDRGAGGEEAQRVTAAVTAAGVANRVRFWEGSFAGFASIIRQSDLYAGYDSAGQHAAAAAGTPLITVFAGAVNDRFRERWSPFGRGPIAVIDAAGLTPNLVYEKFLSALEALWNAKF